MAVPDLIRLLAGDPRHRDRLAHIETIPPLQPRYGSLARPLHPDLEAYLGQKRIRLYTGQCEAIERIRRGEDVIITTPTASGKTLAFTLPVFERLADDPAATALLLYPAKALANDQMKAIRELERFSGIRTDAAIYDGDTPQSRRPAIRERARIVLSNPYELHQILPWHAKWGRFLGNLAFIVIDEAHRYRGVFGSHIAAVIRRLIRICRFYGSDPRFVLSTATIANPEEFAERLTGRRAVWIDEDGSPRGQKHVILYNPYFDGTGDRSVHRETEALFLASIRSGCRTLCFTVSRKMAELIAAWAQDDLGGGHADRVASYRAGYLPEERRAIEDALKSGRLRGVVATNALELGIDVGPLDGVIVSGYPGTMMSFWQQAGRAGRRCNDAFAILVGFANPLDQYFMRHPAAFFARPHEHAIVDTQNPFITAGHLLCAASELPVDPERDRAYFGEGVDAMLAALEAHHLLRKTTRGWVYAGRGRAVDAVRLDSVSSDTFRVLCGGRLLETMDRTQAYREAHPGAVLLHRGETYTVTEMDPAQRIVRVRREDVDYYTQPITETTISVTAEAARRSVGGVTISFGEVEVTDRVAGYTARRYDRIVCADALDLPPLIFSTKALWFTVPDAVADAVAAAGLDLAGGLHGAEHALIAVAPFRVVCDRGDIGGLSSPLHPATDAPTIFLYDGYEGGIGLAEKAYDLLPELVAMTAELIRDCPCDGGCPACIHSPKCGNGNQPLDKRAALALLEGIGRRLSGGGDRVGGDR